MSDKELDRSVEPCCDAPERRDASVCNECGNKGKPVTETTLKNLVGSQKLESIEHLNGFYFCETPACKTVYFTNEQQIYLYKKDVKIRIGVKEIEDPIQVCYCFGWTREKIFDQIRQQGYSTAAQEIGGKIRAGKCSCQINNPSGSCCLAELNKVVKMGMERYSKNEIEEQRVSKTNESVSIYKVPLVCPAAPNIGCGSKSKPILQQLEDQSITVDEAWLYRTGTHIAIVWAKNSLQTDRLSRVKSILSKNSLNVEEIVGEEYAQLLKSFLSRARLLPYLS